VALSRPEQACFCTCCCSSKDPTDSDDEPLPGHPDHLYNRRYDCSCKQRWSFLDNPSVEHMVIRARDVGRDGLALHLEEMLQRINYYRRVLK
jgi:hypothetical protein